MEFSAQIEDGIIRLPKELEAYRNIFARIIILTERLFDHSSKKEQLKAVMLKMGEKEIFSKIVDGVEWQKKVRNERD
ncbi:MAG: hypothetical protein ACOYPR_22260 [Saprospiraceae bacterium]